LKYFAKDFGAAIADVLAAPMETACSSISPLCYVTLRFLFIRERGIRARAILGGHNKASRVARSLP
jgi:hypothetical protein